MISYDQRIDVSVIDNSEEHKLFAAILEELKIAQKNDKWKKLETYGDFNPSFWNERLGDNELKLIHEQAQIKNFPDFTLVGSRHITIFDHFRVDGSKWTKSKGSSLMSMQSNTNIGVNKSTVEYNKENWIMNLTKVFENHAQKLKIYDSNIRNYIRDLNLESSHKDLKKPREVWFLIEDKSNIKIPKEAFITLSKLLNNKQSPNAVIYVVNPFDDVKLNLNNIAFIKNDNNALIELSHVYD